jgi:hypothetical protein
MTMTSLTHTHKRMQTGTDSVLLTKTQTKTLSQTHTLSHTYPHIQKNKTQGQES